MKESFSLSSGFNFSFSLSLPSLSSLSFMHVRKRLLISFTAQVNSYQARLGEYNTQTINYYHRRVIVIHYYQTAFELDDLALVVGPQFNY